jgi:hypothetical protein
VWRAVSATVAGAVTARAFIDARHAVPSVPRTLDPLVKRLYARGECAEEAGLLKVRLPDRRLVDRDGTAHPRRFALAPWSTGGVGPTAHPDAVSTLVRQADTLARAILAEAVTGPAARVA